MSDLSLPKNEDYQKNPTKSDKRHLDINWELRLHFGIEEKNEANKSVKTLKTWKTR